MDFLPYICQCPQQLNKSKLHSVGLLWIRLGIIGVGKVQGGVTPQSSVLPPATVVKHEVKGQEAKIVKVKGQA